MSQNPTSPPREDPPASGPAPDVQVPGDSSHIWALKNEIAALEALPNFDVWSTFGDVSDPSQPIPADDEQPDVEGVPV